MKRKSSSSALEVEFTKDKTLYHLEVDFEQRRENDPDPVVNILSVVDENENESDPDIWSGNLDEADWDAIAKTCKEMTR